ncbi:DUF4126 domain-containing protein [Chelatococcus reniformis]|uniref:Membrane protein n=1 Tax=Chelatococcus reniformis TaxID=1494448 RepID=A0A916U9G5_9HYPH|nr:DUF4126 domain-containing protein [Chelatococcus reniformis]GGC64753.1 membrane protein [Chelatococcus reniformis]
MALYVLALLIGIVAGLRTMTAPAAVSWAAYAGWLPLASTPLAFLGYSYVAYILIALAVVELITDQLPSTPSRKVPVQFGGRIVSGALAGAAIGAAAGGLVGGLIAGAIGAVLGTLGGYEFRTRLVRASGGRDLPIALLEDAIAIVAAGLIVAAAGRAVGGL